MKYLSTPTCIILLQNVTTILIQGKDIKVSFVNGTSSFIEFNSTEHAKENLIKIRSLLEN